MGSGFRNPIIGGGGALVYPSIHSPNYVPGVTGWQLKKDGTGELNITVTIRGSILDKEGWLSGLALPSGLGYTVQAETFPRLLAQQTNSLTSGIPRFTVISLPAGITLSRMTMVTGNLGESGGSHGWYALLDNTGKVVAVTADQTGATVWGSIQSPVTLPFTASYKTTYRGNYIAMISVTASSLPNIAGQNGPATGAIGLAPVLAGLGPSGLNTPPALGTVISPLTAAGVGLYAAVG